MKAKIGFFKDKKDLNVKITNEKILNITGMVGSGKSTYADKYRKNKKYLVISLDCLYKGIDNDNMNDDTMKINEIILSKYPLQDNENNYKDYYNIVCDYLLKDKRKHVIEGQQIYRFMSPNDVRGILIIKMTSIFHSWYRCLKRQTLQNLTKYKEGSITKKYMISNNWYWYKRRTMQIKYYKTMNNFIKNIKNIDYL